jgi:hypothetical protein
VSAALDLELTSLRDATRGKSLQRARTCYDHLAGRLGVALAGAFERDTARGGQQLLAEFAIKV